MVSKSSMDFSQPSARPGGGTLPTSYWGTLTRTQRVPAARLDAMEAAQNSLRESQWVGRHTITYSKDNHNFSNTQRELKKNFLKKIFGYLARCDF